MNTGNLPIDLLIFRSPYLFDKTNSLLCCENLKTSDTLPWICVVFPFWKPMPNVSKNL